MLRALQAGVASSGAFAALTAQGTVVTWGDAEAGGDSSTVQVPMGMKGDGDLGDGDRLGDLESGWEDWGVKGLLESKVSSIDEVLILKIL